MPSPIVKRNNCDPDLSSVIAFISLLSLTTHSSVDVIVVPHERIKSSDLHPTNTEVLVCVVEKSADVGTNERNTVQLECQNSCNRKQNIPTYL